MTVTTLPSEVFYDGDGVSLEFAVPFRFLADGDLRVALVAADGTETVQSLGSGYTVTGAGNAGGGAVTFAVAPADGITVYIKRNTSLQQQTDYEDGKAFRAAQFETDLDRAAMRDQEMRDLMARAARQKDREAAADMTLPFLDARASRVMGFDAAGQPAAGPLIANIDAAIAAFLAGASIGDIPSVNSIATMEVLTGIIDKAVIHVVGYYGEGTPGGGNFQFFAGSATPIDGGLVFSAVGGRWKRIRYYREVTTSMYGAIGDGAADDYTAIMRVHDYAPAGSKVLVDGALRHTSALVFTRRLNWWCDGLDNYFKPDLTTTQDAMTITGSASASPADCRINMFSAANTCRDGLILRNFNASRITTNVQVGGVGWNVKALGCIESVLDVRSTVNYTNPLGSPYSCPGHLYIDAYGGIYNNSNVFLLDLAGQTKGVEIADQAQQGNSLFKGTIQGLTGVPFKAAGCAGMSVSNLHMEGCPTPPEFDNCVGTSIEHVLSATSGAWAFTNCIGTYFNEFTGGLNVASSCKFTRFGTLRTDGDSFSNADITATVAQGISSTSSSSSLAGGPGGASMLNLFHNPWIEMFTNGAAAAPEGFSAGAATFARETSTVYGGNPRGISCKVTSTATVLADMLKITLASPYATYAMDRWLAIAIALYVASGQADLLATVNNSVSYLGGELVTLKNAWHVVRTAVYVPAGATPFISIAPYNAGYVSGQYFVGAVAAVHGMVAPQHFDAGPARSDFLVGSVANAPGFLNQEALVAGVFYKAAGTSVAGDWKPIS